jgi:hypothetical protein
LALAFANCGASHGSRRRAANVDFHGRAARSYSPDHSDFGDGIYLWHVTIIGFVGRFIATWPGEGQIAYLGDRGNGDHRRSRLVRRVYVAPYRVAGAGAPRSPPGLRLVTVTI